MERRTLGLPILLTLLLAALPLAAAPAGPAAQPTLPSALDLTAVWYSHEQVESFSVAWGDWDSDGDLDLATGTIDHNYVYENIGTELYPVAVWASNETDYSRSVAWGDWDDDGDLDLAVGNYGDPNRVYENVAGTLSLAWSSTEQDNTVSVAWGDWDGDGDLDLAVGNSNQPDQLYENVAGGLDLVWASADQDDTTDIAWADWDGDGDLDLASGNREQPNRVYENVGWGLTPAWSSSEEDRTEGLAWGDWDNDGDLDLAVANWLQPNRIYANDAGSLNLTWSSAEEDPSRSVAWGDWDGDGDLDLAVANDGSPNRVYQRGGLLQGGKGGPMTLAWSSTEEDRTLFVAWGDWNNDGDLDLAVANYGLEPERVYENLAGPIHPTAEWSSDEAENSTDVAWGDWDGDGDLDLAVANFEQANRVYENDGGALALAWSSVELDASSSLAWGDWDGDGDLDLVVGNIDQPNRVYQNEGGALILVWTSIEQEDTRSVAWGDWDGDGDLDLAVANFEQANRVYRNMGGDLEPVWTSPESENTMSVAWGDWDSDGDLDLAAANVLQFNRVYENEGGTLNPAWSDSRNDNTYAVAWGDWDGDGDLDLAVGNTGQVNLLYRNDGGGLTLAWTADEVDSTSDVAWGDWDGDGDLDLATANWSGPNRVYENWGSELDPAAVWSSDESDQSVCLAWGDWDYDGDLDLVVGNTAVSNRLYENNRVSFPNLPNNTAYPRVWRPGVSADAYFYASAEILTSAIIPIEYNVYDVEGDSAPRVVGRYSTDGGGQWHVATTTSGAAGTPPAGPSGGAATLYWNALADGARGDNVIFRIISVLDNPTHVAMPIQRPYMSTQTPPFRIRPLAVSLWPPNQLGIGLGGQVLTHTLTLLNRTGRTATFALAYDSFRGWPVDGPSLVGPIPDLDFASFIVSTTVPAGPPQVLDVVTATAAALFNPTTFQAQAHIFTFRGTPSVTMSVAKEAPITVEAGALMSYTLVAHNFGSSPAGGVVITDVLPAEVEFAWASEDGVYSPTLGAVFWPDNVLLPGRALTVTVAVTVNCVPAGTVIVNDDYWVASNQSPVPVPGLPVSTAVLYDAPVAAFSLGATEVNVGEVFTVSNSSQYATGYLWGFGDGVTSTLAEPQHSYTETGSYNVSLLAYNACGADLATAAVTVVLFLQAGFESNAPVCLGEAVVFTNTTVGMLPISYTWSFGDGMTSTVEHPDHTYAVAGDYPVALEAVNAYASDSAGALALVLAPPLAGFSYAVDGLTVVFTNTSSSASTYLWDFGDGNSDTEEHPVYTYTTGGSYAVTLSATGACGVDQATAVVVVEAGYRVYLPVVMKGYP